MSSKDSDFKGRVRPACRYRFPRVSVRDARLDTRRADWLLGHYVASASNLLYGITAYNAPFPDWILDRAGVRQAAVAATR
jgi:hypothetical protein